MLQLCPFSARTQLDYFVVGVSVMHMFSEPHDLKIGLRAHRLDHTHCILCTTVNSRYNIFFGTIEKKHYFDKNIISRGHYLYTFTFS